MFKRIVIIYLFSVNVIAQSYIYLTNNTNETLLIDVSDRGGSMIEDKHWWQHSQSVKPFETVRFLELNRDTGVTNGSTFYFDSTITAPDGSSLMLQQRLKGTLFFSNMSHGTENSDWHDDRSRYVDSYTFNGGPVEVAYKAVGARSNGDDYYYVIHPEQNYPSVGASNELKVLAYNVWALLPGAVSKSVSERLGELPDEIKGYDVIVFSELFDNSRRETFLNAINGDYPYQTSVVDRSGSIEDGGVLIVSRWPIEASDHIVFNDCGSEDCLSAKGVKYARINKGGNKYHVFGTHAQAFTGDKNVAIRLKQFQQMRNYIDRKNIEIVDPVILAGDFNVDKEDYPMEYMDMLTVLGATEVPNNNPYKYTADGAKNGWHSNAPEILDYVLYSNRHLAPQAATAQVVIPRSIADSVFTKYDLSDHSAIRADISFNTPSVDMSGFTKAVQSKWGCGSDARCDDYLTFSGSDVKIHSTDKVMWKFVPTSVSGEYYIQNKWGCDSGDNRCDAWLSFSDNSVKLDGDIADAVPWKLEVVTNQADGYYIRSRWNCGSNDRRCNHYLTFNGDNVSIAAGERVIWKLVD